MKTPPFHKWDKNIFQCVGNTSKGIPFRTDKLKLEKIIPQLHYLAISEGVLTKQELLRIIEPLPFSKSEVIIYKKEI